MISSHSCPHLHRSRGSALITAVIFTFVTSLLMASILGWAVVERRLNARAAYLNEARNAAEAVCEYGAAQVKYAATNLTPVPSFEPNAPGLVTNSPLQLPVNVVNGVATANSFFNPNSTNGISKESDIDTNPLSTTDGNGLEVVGGPPVNVSSSSTSLKVKTGTKLYYVDPANIPPNETDPFASLWIKRKDYQVVAKATAVPPNGDPPVSAYVREVLSVRAAPLFEWAIFYASSDLEIFPGAQMVINGPVHTNFNMLAYANAGGSLKFYGPVTVTGNIYHAPEYPPSDNGQSNPVNSEVSFAQNQGNGGNIAPFNMYSEGFWHDSSFGTDQGLSGSPTSGSKALDSLLTPSINAQFATYAKKTWPTNNLLTSAMGVQAFNPAGFTYPLISGTDPNGSPYVADSEFVDNGSQFPLQLPYQVTSTLPSYSPPIIDTHIIDPTTSPVTTAKGNVSYLNDPPDDYFARTMVPTSTYYVGRKGLEDIKYANIANLYILVIVNTSTPTFSAKVYYYGPYNSRNIGATGYGPNGGICLGEVDYGANGLPAASPVPNEPTALVRFVPYSEDASNTYVLTGLYDQRQKAPADLVELNVTALRLALTAVNTGDPTYAIMNNSLPSPNNDGTPTIWGSGTMGHANTLLNDNTAGYRDSLATWGGWNGIIYIDVEYALTSAHGHQVGVAIDNALTTPQPAHLDGVTGGVTNNLIPNDVDANGNPAPITANDPTGLGAVVGPGTFGANGTKVPGLTIATDAPVYIVGNFNADGKHLNADASSQPDDEDPHSLDQWPTVSQEVPASVIGDAVTILSPNFFDPNPANSNNIPATNPGSIGATNASSTTSNAFMSKKNGENTNNGNSEVAMGMIAGLVLSCDKSPDGSQGTVSGGVHNFPRLLETWNSAPMVIRGSLVNMFTSKIAIQPYRVGAYYTPVTRDWGHDDLFAFGIFPPGTPYTYDVRRLSFQELPSTSSYSNARIDPTWGWPNDTFH